MRRHLNKKYVNVIILLEYSQPLDSLTLKMLRDQFEPTCVVFLKLCFLERVCSPDFLWLFILSQVTFFLKTSSLILAIFANFGIF